VKVVFGFCFKTIQVVAVPWSGWGCWPLRGSKKPSKGYIFFPSV